MTLLEIFENFCDDFFELIVENSINYGHEKGCKGFSVTKEEIRIFIGYCFLLAIVLSPDEGCAVKLSLSF